MTMPDITPNQDTGNIIDGKAIGLEVRAQVAKDVAQFVAERGRAPGLHVVLVGEDAASQVYVRNKERAAEKAGIVGKVHRLPADTTQEALEALIDTLNADDRVDGILVQMPLPQYQGKQHLNEKRIVERLDPAKDVDGLHAVNLGKLTLGEPGLRPCTPSGCMHLLDRIGYKAEGKHAVVIGRSMLVGKPAALLLLERNATVTMAHSRTQDLAGVCRTADILVTAVGRPNMVKGDWVKQGAVVLDVGINRQEDGTLTGDVDYAEVSKRAAWITPVPGGVGPMTIAMLLKNTLEAAIARVS